MDLGIAARRRPPWRVGGVDADWVRARQAVQITAAHEFDLVCRGVLGIQRLFLVLAVIAHARYVLHFLPERAAEGDVHFLEAAADGEARQARRDEMIERLQRVVAHHRPAERLEITEVIDEPRAHHCNDLARDCVRNEADALRALIDFCEKQLATNTPSEARKLFETLAEAERLAARLEDFGAELRSERGRLTSIQEVALKQI